MTGVASTPAPARERLRALLAEAELLLAAMADATRHEAPSRRIEGRLSHAIDARDAVPRDGTLTPLAAPVPDGIPMTGEEDPLVEVEDPEFAGIVAEFMRSERAAATRAPPPRELLARALAPFAANADDPAALLRAIELPFARYAALVATDRGGSLAAQDAALVESLVTILRNATSLRAEHQACAGPGPNEDPCQPG